MGETDCVLCRKAASFRPRDLGIGWKSDAADQILEPRIISQAVEGRIRLQPHNQTVVAFFVQQIQ